METFRFEGAHLAAIGAMRERLALNGLVQGLELAAAGGPAQDGAAQAPQTPAANAPAPPAVAGPDGVPHPHKPHNPNADNAHSSHDDSGHSQHKIPPSVHPNASGKIDPTKDYGKHADEHHAGKEPGSDWVKPVEYKPDPAHPLSPAEQKKEADYEKTVASIKNSPEFKQAQQHTKGVADHPDGASTPPAHVPAPAKSNDGPVMSA